MDKIELLPDYASLAADYRRSFPDIAAFWNAVVNKLISDFRIERVCGYDPQKLLPDHSMQTQMQRFLDEYNRAMATQGEVTFIMRGDYFEIMEQHVMSFMEPGFIHIDIESPGGEVPGFPDIYERMIKRHTMRVTKDRAKKPPGYLKHDPSKNHKRRR